MTAPREQSGEPSRWSFYLLVFSLGFSPYYIIAHELLGQPTVFGKALFLALLTASVVLVFVANGGYMLDRMGGWLLFVVWLCAVVVLALRSVLYGIGMDLFSYRFPFVIFIYGCVALPFVCVPRRLVALRRVLLWSCVVQAVLGVIHSRYFPYIVTGIQLDDSGQAIYVLDPGMGGYRENGTLITANLYGAFLVLGLILLLANTPRITRRTVLRYGPVAAVLWWGIALSGSRYALGGAALVSAYFLYRTTGLYAFVVILPVAAFVFASTSAFALMQQRFATEGSGGRVAIAAATVDLSTRRTSNLLLGAPPAEESAMRTRSGQILSDNSFASMMLDYGLPFTLVLIFCVCIVWSSLVRMSGWVLVAAMFVIGQFAVTNALYWEPFLLFAGATMLVLNGLRGPGALAAPTTAAGL